MKGSVLIDSIVKSDNCQVGIIDEKTKKEKWYIAKPLKSGSILSKLMRVYSAWLVLTGKSFAVHYKEDEKRIKNVGVTITQ